MPAKIVVLIVLNFIKLFRLNLCINKGREVKRFSSPFTSHNIKKNQNTLTCFANLSVFYYKKKI